MKTYRSEPPISVTRLASRICILTDVPYDNTLKVVKAVLILLAQFEHKQLKTLLLRYKKFKGFVPYHLERVHE